MQILDITIINRPSFGTKTVYLIVENPIIANPYEVTSPKKKPHIQGIRNARVTTLNITNSLKLLYDVYKKKKKKTPLVMPLIIKCKSCCCKEYSRSHQTLKMFTLPKLILIPNNRPINTPVSSFVCVYFSTYLAPAWNKHFVSMSNPVF